MAFAIKIYRSIHMGRVLPEMDQSVAELMENSSVNLKRVKTRRNMGLTRLPAKLELAAQVKIEQVADRKLRQESKELISTMYNFKLPDDEATIKIKKADIRTQLEIRGKIKDIESDPAVFKLKEEVDIAHYELKELIKGTLDDRRRDWHYYEYDDYSANLYMAVRLPANYACLKTILSEIRDLDPSFKPNSVLDFGSGMGTTIWAVNHTWPGDVDEFMNIDLSKSQQHLCESLLRGGREFGAQLPGVFHRQYLPTSTKVKYDMVVSAYTLLELPNAELRANTIENLWQKTNDFLVLVERGTKGGFEAINEARHLILDLSGYDVTERIKLSHAYQVKSNVKKPQAHVFAPCPHEFACPRISMSSKKRGDICRFRTIFEPLELGQQKSGFVKEDFSYVVMRKQPLQSYFGERDARWPRVVEKRLHSSGMYTHKICCSNGCLGEVVTTKKYGKRLFDIAKSCDWGDILPIKVKDTYEKKSFNKNHGSIEHDNK